MKLQAEFPWRNRQYTPLDIFEFGTTTNTACNGDVYPGMISCSGDLFGQQETFEFEKQRLLYWNYGVVRARNARKFIDRFPLEDDSAVGLRVPQGGGAHLSISATIAFCVKHFCGILFILNSKPTSHLHASCVFKYLLFVSANTLVEVLRTLC